MRRPITSSRIFCFLGGAFCVLVLLFLIGATSSHQTGRYEMQVVVKDRSSQIYVLDTASGAVKWVNEMNTPFERLK